MQHDSKGETHTLKLKATFYPHKTVSSMGSWEPINAKTYQ
jgi:hypothetical protein